MARTTISLGMEDALLAAIDRAIASRRAAQPFRTLSRMGFIRDAIERAIEQGDAECIEEPARHPRRREAYRAVQI